MIRYSNFYSVGTFYRSYFRYYFNKNLNTIYVDFNSNLYRLEFEDCYLDLAFIPSNCATLFLLDYEGEEAIDYLKAIAYNSGFTFIVTYDTTIPGISLGNLKLIDIPNFTHEDLKYVYKDYDMNLCRNIDNDYVLYKDSLLYPGRKLMNINYHTEFFYINDKLTVISTGGRYLPGRETKKKIPSENNLCTIYDNNFRIKYDKSQYTLIKYIAYRTGNNLITFNLPYKGYHYWLSY